MLRRKIIIALAFFATLAPGLQAQQVHPDYWDGKIYLQLKLDSDLHFADVADWAAHPNLGRLVGRYGITHIERPFVNLRTPRFERCYRVHFGAAGQVDALIRDLGLYDMVEYAERVPIERISEVPNDPSIGNQYALDKVNAFAAFDIHKGGNAVIAVVDDGVRITHQDLADNIWVNPGEIPNNGLDDDGNGYVDDVNGYDVANNDPNPTPGAPTAEYDFAHGTHVAGIVSAKTNNGIGIASIGYNCKIMGVKTKPDGSTGPSLPFAMDGVAYAIAAGADVINMSFGGSGYSATNEGIILLGNDVDIVMVAAAGNENSSSFQYPAAYNHVISVANTNQNDVRNPSSNYGDWVDISAPGTGIYSTVNGNSTYGYFSGTSMASPLVAGLCGLMRSINSDMSAAEIEQCIKSTAVNINSANPSFLNQLGAGRIDALAAMLCAVPPVPPGIQIGASQTNLCAGNAVQFQDASLYGPNTWQWSFPGGSPATSTEQNPLVLYEVPGSYDVTLTATNITGTNSLTFPAFIQVTESAEELVYAESFEGGLGGWSVRNPDQGKTWTLRNLSGNSINGSRIVGIDNFGGAGAGSRDFLISPPISLYGRDFASLTFDYVYRMKPLVPSDSLIISASIDGGNTFPIRLLAAADNGSNNFATHVPFNGGISPSTLADWCHSGDFGADCITVDISAVAGQPDVRLRFENYDAGNNNLFLDNIEVFGGCASSAIAPYADFRADTLGGCDSIYVQFTDLSQGAVSEREWAFPGGLPSSSSLPSPIIVFLNNGTYDVSLTVSNPSGSQTLLREDYILVTQSAPVADFSAAVNAQTVQFTNLSDSASYFLWDFGDGSSSTLRDPQHYFAAGGNYTVTLTAFNGCGSDVRTLAISTSGSQAPALPAMREVQLSPNPVRGGDARLAWQQVRPGELDVRLLNILGQTLWGQSLSLPSGPVQIDVPSAGLPAGTYLIHLSDRQGGQGSYKLVVE